MKYELMYVVPAKYTEDELKGLSGKIEKILSANGSTKQQSVVLGRRKLAYPIKHTRNGFYVMVDFEAESVAVDKMNQALRLSPDILRHLIIQKDPLLKGIPEFADSGEIIAKKERSEEERPGSRDRKAAPRARRAPARPAEALTMKDLDKKLDEILTEEVK